MIHPEDTYECGSDGMQDMFSTLPVLLYASLKVMLPLVNQQHRRAQSTLSNLAPVFHHRCIQVYAKVSVDSIKCM